MDDRNAHWLRSYHKEWLRSDLIGGLTAAAVVIPMAMALAMAYATIASLPLQVGLYTALVPILVYALVGSSRPLSVSTTSTIAVLTGHQLAGISAAGDQSVLLGALAMLTLVVGASEMDYPPAAHNFRGFRPVLMSQTGHERLNSESAYRVRSPPTRRHHRNAILASYEPLSAGPAA